MRVFIKIIAFLLVIFTIPPLSISAKSVDVGKISALSACLIEAESERVIYSKNEQKCMSMASTTKIMTAILALESGIPLNKVIKIPKEAVGVEGSSIYLREDEEITFEALIYGLLLSSANDSAIAIAISVSENVENFVALMNEKAAILGLSNTHFENPHGLYAKEHYTTAYDLAKLMAYCVKNEIFLNISGCYRKTVQADENLTRVMINHNRLLRTYEGMLAGKTGFTKASGRCLVTCAERDNLRLIAVTLDAPDDWHDHTALLDFGFERYTRLAISKKGDFGISLAVSGGNENKVIAVNSDDISALLTTNHGEISYKIEAIRPITAPIKSGDILGHVIFYEGQREIANSPLVAKNEVHILSNKPNFWTKLKNFFMK